jgi:uncharacterized membrane protein YedE/YeeE
MRNHIATLLAGLLFGAGLVISDMANPQRVLAFLRWGPGWDPSLALVMLGALAITVPGFAWMRLRGRPFLAPQFTTPAAGAIDRRLLLGATVFGIGWGWVGYCPGPALVGVGLGHWSAVVFVAAMLSGAWVTTRLQQGRGASPPT